MGHGALRRVWKGRGGIMPGDVTHPDFIKRAVSREPERVSPGGSSFPPLCIQLPKWLGSLQPSSRDPAKVGTLPTGLGTALAKGGSRPRVFNPRPAEASSKQKARDTDYP